MIIYQNGFIKISLHRDGILEWMELYYADEFITNTLICDKKGYMHTSYKEALNYLKTYEN